MVRSRADSLESVNQLENGPLAAQRAAKEAECRMRGEIVGIVSISHERRNSGEIVGIVAVLP
jgi:hypothetical protein